MPEHDIREIASKLQRLLGDDADIRLRRSVVPGALDLWVVARLSARARLADRGRRVLYAENRASVVRTPQLRETFSAPSTRRPRFALALARCAAFGCSLALGVGGVGQLGGDA